MTPPCSTQLTGQPVKKGERVASVVVQVADSPDTAVLVARISSTQRLVGPSDAGPNAYSSSAKPTLCCTRQSRTQEVQAASDTAQQAKSGVSRPGCGRGEHREPPLGASCAQTKMGEMRQKVQSSPATSVTMRDRVSSNCLSQG
jgi:hypothetical protein